MRRTIVQAGTGANGRGVASFVFEWLIHWICSVKTKKLALKEGKLSDPTIHYTIMASRLIDVWADSMLCFWRSNNSRVLATRSVSCNTEL